MSLCGTMILHFRSALFPHFPLCSYLSRLWRCLLALNVSLYVHHFSLRASRPGCHITCMRGRRGLVSFSSIFLGVFLQVGLLDEYRIVQSWAGPRFEKEQGVVDLGRFHCW